MSLGSWLIPDVLALPMLETSWDRAYLGEVGILEVPLSGQETLPPLTGGTKSREGFLPARLLCLPSVWPRALWPHSKEWVWSGRRDMQADKATCPSYEGSGDGLINLFLSVKDISPR